MNLLTPYMLFCVGVVVVSRMWFSMAYPHDINWSADA